jgi:arylsulfatase A-like enzyme
MSASLSGRRPNILLLFADQLRHDSLGGYGHPAAITPNLDRLAAEGVRFTRCYANNPVCLPSRSSLMTGRYCHQHHCHRNDDVLARDEVCYPAMLRDSGYFTAVVGKLHLWEQFQDRCTVDHGFQVRETVEGKFSLSGRVDESWPYFDFLEDRGLDLPYRFGLGDEAKASLFSRISEYEEGDHLDGWIAERAIRQIRRGWMRDRPGGGPRVSMMQVGLCSPHPYYDPPRSCYDLYEDVEIPAPTATAEGLAAKGPAVRAFHEECRRNYGLSALPYDEESLRRIREMRRCYLACVSQVDRQVGRIVEALKESGLYEDTIIVFSADHGDYQGDHGLIRKEHFLYEANVHVPLIVHSPLLDGGGRECDEPVQLLDLFATFLDLAGLEAPPQTASRSLLGLLDGEQAGVRQAVFAECGKRKMIRRGEHKLLTDGTAEGLELYDLAADPREQVNLAADGGCGPLCRELLAELASWPACTGG